MTHEALEMMEISPTAQTTALAERGTTAVAPQSADDLLFTAMQRGFTAEQIGQLMDLRDRQEAHLAEKAFRDAFAAFRGENIIIPLTKDVDRGRAGSFVQAEYHVAANMLSPALSRHGFSFRHDQKFTSRPWTTDGVVNDVAWVIVTCYLEHRAGHAEKLQLEGPPGDLSANSPTQNMQATASYLKRQSLLAITGTATGGEDDETKMRGASSGSTGGGSQGDDDPLLDEGREEALKGMQALTAWWGKLNAKQRSNLNKEFTRMRRTAQSVDEETGRG